MSAAILEQLDAIQQALDALRARVIAEAEPAEPAMVAVIADSLGGRLFTTAELLAHARLDASVGLRRAIERAVGSVDNPGAAKRVGRALRRQSHDGGRVERVAEERGGWIWRIVPT